MFMRSVSRHRRAKCVLPRRGLGERGAALVEFALLLPVLMMIVLGTIDFGYLINRSTLLDNAAREGAREAVFDSDAVAIEARVRAAAPSLDQSLLTVTLSCQLADGSACPGVSFDSEWEAGGTVIVLVEYDYEYLNPGAGILGLGPTRHLESTIQMRIEG